MPQGPMSSPLMKPFVVLALPGMYLFYKYNQYKRKRKENAKRRLTERELQHLNSKIGADIVLLLGAHDPKDKSIRAMVMDEGERVVKLAKDCVTYAPRAVIVVCAPPVVASTTLVDLTFKKSPWYHPGRIIGSAAYAQVKANTMLGRFNSLEPQLCTVPIIGGPDVETAVPLFSKGKPAEVPEHMCQNLTAHFRNVKPFKFPKTICNHPDRLETAPMAEAFSLNRLVTTIGLGICGDSSACACALVRANLFKTSKHLVTTVQFVHGGVFHNFGIPNLTNLELHLFGKALLDMKEKEEDKLLNKLEESEPELATTQEEECVICIHAKATMQTSPCGHQVVCRKCFVKTIQIAVSQRLLPLRCVICRAKILRLKTGPILPTSASGYSVNSRASSVPQSDSLYSVSSGGSSVSSTSCSSDCSRASSVCCNKGQCLGAYPRQPVTGAIRRSQQHAMKIRLQEYCRPEKNHVNRLPPIREMPGASPLHAPPPSTRIRCAQKILTQLETNSLLGSKNSKNYKYEKLPQTDDDELDKKPAKKEGRSWWSDKRWNDRTKSEERIDNKKNEIVEKQLELKEKQKLGLKPDGKKKEKNKTEMKNNSTNEETV